MRRFSASISGGLLFTAAAIFLLPGAASAGITAGHVKNSPAKEVRAAAGANHALVEPPRGQSYDNLANAFWQWALGIPTGRNPLIDPDGRDCAVGQEGPVWFLAGSFGDSVTRACTVPAGRLIFLPVYIWVFGAGAFDCDPSIPGVPCNVEELKATAAENVDKVETMNVTIDGVAVTPFRGASANPFAIFYPENSVTGLPRGGYYPNVADGYWVLINPLPPGEHVVNVSVSAPDTIFGLIQFSHSFTINVE